jgi:catechol 2,3-dioxygenase-like lactoylglutathione lyase family enzyme
VLASAILLAAPVAVAGQAVATSGASPVTDVLSPQYFAVLVADADSSVAWYRRVFGLREVDRSQAPDGAWQIINVAGPSLFIEIIRDSREPATVRGRGIAKVGFAVPDVRAAAAAIGRLTGVTPRVLEFPQHGLRLIQVRDPDGNIIQLSSMLAPR